MLNYVHERLRQARLERGEPLPDIAHRIGAKPALLEALEAGQYSALPSGIYARAVVRNYARALGFDPEETLRECHGLLPGVEDPIEGLARVRGLKPAASAPRTEQTDPAIQNVAPGGVRLPDAWRPLAAMAIDSGILMGSILVVVALTALALQAPLASAARQGAPAFALMAALFGVLYFVLFGGIGNGTVGAQLTGAVFVDRPTGPMAFDATLVRAWECALREAKESLIPHR